MPSFEKLNTAQYQHFSFDMWLTLIRSHPDFKEARARWLKQFLGISQPLQEVQHILRSVDLEANALSERTGKHLYAEDLFAEIFRRLGVQQISFSWPDFWEQHDALFLSYRPQLINPEVGHFLNHLCAQGKTVSLLSNTAFIRGNLLHQVLEYYGLASYFAFELYSDELGNAKPNPLVFEEAYQRAFALRPLHKNQFVHIGDNPIADVQGAQQAGLHAFQFEF